MGGTGRGVEMGDGGGDESDAANAGVRGVSAVGGADVSGDGLAMRVHREMPRGLREGEYARALYVALRGEGLEVARERPVPVTIDGAIVGLLRPDLTVAPGIPVELKAVRHLMTGEELRQVIAHIVALQAPLGLCLNFGRPSLEHHRVFPPRQVTDQRALMQRALHADQSHRPARPTHPRPGNPTHP